MTMTECILFVNVQFNTIKKTLNDKCVLNWVQVLVNISCMYLYVLSYNNRIYIK